MALELHDEADEVLENDTLETDLRFFTRSTVDQSMLKDAGNKEASGSEDGVRVGMT